MRDPRPGARCEPGRLHPAQSPDAGMADRVDAAEYPVQPGGRERLFDLVVAELDGEQLLARDDSMLARCQLRNRVIRFSGGRNLLNRRVSHTGSDIAPRPTARVA